MRPDTVVNFRDPTFATYPDDKLIIYRGENTGHLFCIKFSP